VAVETPFGNPSDTLRLGTLAGQRVAFLPRHGRGHRISPTELPVRANIYALKSLGVERIISLSAVGSLRADYAPLDIVIPDQLFDRTHFRANTFFGDGIVAHVSLATPFCPELSAVLYQAANEAGAKTHRGGSIVVIEGPAFSTKAESKAYRQLGFDLVGMTALPEAKLAREAEICYATIAMVTDYDVWHPDHDSVTVEMVVGNLLKNAEIGKEIVKRALPHVPAPRTTCPCHNALQNAIITARDQMPASTKSKLNVIAGKYF
jgi:5'-methylthioadenosine phosphorylase